MLHPTLRANIWKPGQSGNPAGKPPGTRGLIRFLRESTRDGRELIEKLLEIARNGGEADTDQLKALTYLVDKVLPYVDDGSGLVLDGDKLTDSERAELAAIHARVRAISEEVRTRTDDKPA